MNKRAKCLDAGLNYASYDYSASYEFTYDTQFKIKEVRMCTYFATNTNFSEANLWHLCALAKATGNEEYRNTTCYKEINASLVSDRFPLGCPTDDPPPMAPPAPPSLPPPPPPRTPTLKPLQDEPLYVLLFVAPYGLVLLVAIVCIYRLAA